MTMYKNKKNGTVAEFIEKNEVAKTVTLKKEDGGFTAVSISTFQRWWQKLTDEATTDGAEAEQVEEVAQEMADAEVEQVENAESAATEEVVNDAEVESTEDVPKPKKEKKAKEKKEKKEKAPKEKAPEVDIEGFRQKVVSIGTSMGFGTKFYDNRPKFVGLMLGGKCRVDARFSNKWAKLCIKSAVVPEGVEYTKVKNFFLDASLTVPYEGFEEAVTQILTWALASAPEPKPVKEKKEKAAKKENVENIENEIEKEAV